MNDAIVIKSINGGTNPFARLLSPAAVGIGDAITWPVDPLALARMYLSSTVHATCCHRVAEAAFGYGTNSPRLDDLCEAGAIDLLVTAGLDLRTYGNAFIQRVRHRQRLVALRTLPAWSVSRRRDGSYVQVIDSGSGTPETIPLAADEVLHLRAPDPLRGHYALPQWISSGPMMGLANAATEYNQRFFDNNGLPDAILTVAGAILTDNQKKQAQEFFGDNYKGLYNARKTLLLNFDNKEVSVDVNIPRPEKDGDFLKLLEFARDDIPIAHGVPSRLVGIAKALGIGGQGEQSAQMVAFERFTCLPVRRAVAGQLRPLLQEAGIDHRQFVILPPPDVDGDGKADDTDDAQEATAELLKSFLGTRS